MGRTVEVSRIRAVAHSVAVKLTEIATQTVALAQVLIATAILVFAWGMMDREPPFTLISVSPSSARPGDLVTIKAKVKRDIERQCDAEFSRYLFALTPGPDLGAPIETRFVLGSSMAPHSMIAMMEKTWPGGLVISERVPETVLAGPAKITADINYVCNKGHRLWPITVHMEMPFTVLP